MVRTRFEELLKVDVKFLARKIDHTLLKPEATARDVERVCKEAIEYNFAACYIAPSYVRLAYDTLKGTGVKLGSVVAFPHGTLPMELKVKEAEWLVVNNVDEVDMVINLGAVKGKNFDLIEEEVANVANVVHDHGAILKVIIETGLLTDEEKIEVVKRLIKAKADYVKTSTGFLGKGATLYDIYLLKRVSKGKIKIKAAGGIRHPIDALLMIQAGADRIGTSTGVKIIEEFKKLKEMF